RKKLRHTVNVILRLFAERFELLHRTTAARRCQSQARQHEGGGHDLHEMPARQRIGKLARTRRKLPLQPLAKLRLLSQLVETPPILTATLRFRTSWWNCFAHRWQAEQVCKDSTFQSCMAFFPKLTWSASDFGCQARSVILSSGRNFNS